MPVIQVIKTSKKKKKKLLNPVIKHKTSRTLPKDNLQVIVFDLKSEISIFEVNRKVKQVASEGKLNFTHHIYLKQV